MSSRRPIVVSKNHCHLSHTEVNEKTNSIHFKHTYSITSNWILLSPFKFFFFKYLYQSYAKTHSYATTLRLNDRTFPREGEGGEGGVKSPSDLGLASLSLCGSPPPLPGTIPGYVPVPRSYVAFWYAVFSLSKSGKTYSRFVFYMCIPYNSWNCSEQKRIWEWVLRIIWRVYLVA